MSTEQAEAFIARLETDEAFAERLAAIKESPDDVMDLVRSEGYDATPDEIRDAFLEHFGSELDERQLEAIAGGLSEAAGNGIIGAGFGVAVVAIGAGAAAAAA